MKTLEHSEQVSLIRWWSLVHNSFGIPEQLLFAIPNGGERNIVVAARLKAEGVRAGIPDLFLAVPRNGYSGLFVEMKKAKGGRVSDAQKASLEMLNKAGYAVTVCHGFPEAKAEIEHYLKPGGINGTQI